MFGEIWMLPERERERTSIVVIPMELPLVWPTVVPEECKKIGWEGKE